MYNFEIWCKQKEYEVSKYPTKVLKMGYLENQLNFELYVLHKHTEDWYKKETEEQLRKIHWLENKYMEVKGLC